MHICSYTAYRSKGRRKRKEEKKKRKEMAVPRAAVAYGRQLKRTILATLTTVVEETLDFEGYLVSV